MPRKPNSSGIDGTASLTGHLISPHFSSSFSSNTGGKHAGSSSGNTAASSSPTPIAAHPLGTATSADESGVDDAHNGGRLGSAQPAMPPLATTLGAANSNGLASSAAPDTHLEIAPQGAHNRVIARREYSFSHMFHVFDFFSSLDETLLDVFVELVFAC